MTVLADTYFIAMIAVAIFGLPAMYAQAYHAWRAVRVEEKKEKEKKDVEVANASSSDLKVIVFCLHCDVLLIDGSFSGPSHPV